MVEAIAPDGTDQPLDISVLPRRARSCENFLNLHRLGRLRKRFSIAAIAVAQQVTRCACPRKSVNQLLRGPFSRWIRSDAKMDDAAAIMGEHEKDEQQPERHGRHDEEISRD